MKTIKNITVAILATFTLITLSAFGQTGSGDGSSSVSVTEAVPPIPVPTLDIPESVPMSTALLKAYAFTQVKRVFGGANSPSISGTSYFNVEIPEDAVADEESINAIVRSQELKFETDPVDEIFTYLSYEGEIRGNNWAWGFSLFRANGRTHLINGPDGYRLPESAFQLKLELGDRIPFPVRGLEWAQMEYLDAQGNHQYLYFGRDNGRFARMDDGTGILLLGGDDMLDRSGRLFLHFEGNVTAVYDLQTSLRRPLETIRMSGFKPIINGLRTVKADTVLTEILVTPEDDVIQVKVGKMNTDDVIAVMLRYDPATNVQLLPIKVWAVDVDLMIENPLIEWQEIGTSDGSGLRVFPDQRVFIRFERKPNLTPATSGGGSGRG